MSDLWGFKDVRELEKSTKDMPDSILREQIEALSEKTEYTIYGNPVLIKIKNLEITYGMATIFNVLVPKLDNYQKTILIMYSNPETEYPVAISVGRSYEDDCEEFLPQYECESKETFEKALKEILSSEDIMQIIKVLYAKAAMLG